MPFISYKEEIVPDQFVASVKEYEKLNVKKSLSLGYSGR